MAETYKEGNKYYLPVVVDEIDEVADYALNLRFIDGRSCDYVRVMDKPGLLLTADEIIDANIIQAQDNDKTRYEEIKKRFDGVLNNATEMSDEIKVLKSENERLSKQNEELGAKVDNLETELEGAKSINEFAVKTEQTSKKLIEEQRGLIKKYGVVIDVLIDKIVALKKGENNG